MYAIYRRTDDGRQVRYEYVQDAHIFGRNVGVVARLLEPSLTKDAAEPCYWHVDVVAQLPTVDGEGARFVIDLKPRNPSELALYELLDVWGHSDSGSTSAMFRLQGLIVEGTKSELSEKTFVSHNDVFHKTIYSFTYFMGTVQAGSLKGPWNGPNPSPTNSALIWPETLRYFLKCIRTVTPEVLEDA